MATPIPSNAATFSVAELVEVTGARLHGPGGGSVAGVTTDSRADVAAKLFVALAGERYDGHAYVSDAVARGARAIIAEREPGWSLPVPLLVVDSTLRALGAIASRHRRRWPGRLVAIAGSAGKTTTRVACQTLLETARPGRIHATSGNLNNEIGVPMTLLGLTEVHDYALLEVGTNAPNEVRRLAELCQADVAVLTLIGLEHSQGLGDLDSIESEEGDIFEALSPDGVAIGNGDDTRVVRQMTERRPNARRLTYGTGPDTDYCVTHRTDSDLGRSRVDIRRSSRAGSGSLQFESRLLGAPGALAAAAAVAVAESLGIDVDSGLAQSAFMRERLGEQGRLQIVRLDGDIVVLDDSYNANPPSMASSISVARELAQVRRSRLVLVLGEMLELGSLSEREHRHLGAHLGTAAQLIAVGKQAEPLCDSARASGVPAIYCADADTAAEHAAQLAQAGDTLLIKGSRGVRLERVVQALVSRKGHAA